MTTTLPRPASRPSMPRNTTSPPTGALPAIPKKISYTTTPVKTLRRPSSQLSLSSINSASTNTSTSRLSIVVDESTPRSLGNRISSLPTKSPLTSPNSGYINGVAGTSGRLGSGMVSPSPRPSSSLAVHKSRQSMLFSPPKEALLSPGLEPSYFTSASSPPPSRGSSRQASHAGSPVPDGSINGGDMDGKGNVTVSIRIRPDNPDMMPSVGEWTLDGGKALVRWNGKEGGDYYMDNVFVPTDDNEKVYEASAKRLVRRVMEGYHGTVFAYGMTGTGKTFSMQGTAESPGVIPLAITDIFSFIRETPHREFLLRVSYLEIYNEKIHDLLSPNQNSGTGIFGQQVEEIKLREDSKRGVYASPLKEEIVQSPSQLLRVIARGDLARRTGSTQFNARSSRSHAVVQIVVESRERILGPGPGNLTPTDEAPPAGTAIGGVRVSTLSLIDLAGSERAAENKERRTEGAHINRSLLTLGTVIARLSEHKDTAIKEKDGSHLPYRDSKLTRLLQPALSGGSLISILCTMAINGNHGESLNTLKFAARAKNNIVSHAKKAEEALVTDAGSKVLLERYRHEISELRGQLEVQAKIQLESQELEAQRHEEQMLEIQLARTALKERIEHLNRLILSSKSTGVNSPVVNNNGNRITSVRSSTQSQAPPQSLSRTLSSSTFATSIGPPPAFLPSDPGSDDSGGEFGDGSASLATQFQALQADNADKTRYIATLERRLLQARRTSQSRTSLGLTTSPRSTNVPNDEGSVAALLREKDAEIQSLRSQLDDKERMVSALRSAARKRDAADSKSRTKSVDDLVSSRRRTNGISTGSAVGGLLPTSPSAADPLTEEEDEEILIKPLNVMLGRPPSGSSQTVLKGHRESDARVTGLNLLLEGEVLAI